MSGQQRTSGRRPVCCGKGILAGMLLFFFGFFALYLWTLNPSLTPYRDTGEMALSAHTLGISHPPSYPVYILLGRLVDGFPLGNRAFTLALLSVLAGALALAVFFGTLAPRFGRLPAAAGVLLLGTNATFWNVSSVQEMYSLTLLFACVLLALAFRLRERFSARYWYGSVLLGGLFLGNRTDLLLWAPGLLWLAAPRRLLRAPWRERLRFSLPSAGFFFLGLGIYLYLPIRSMQGPWLDWNHPAVLNNFIGSITRRGYGGTLDLLSKNYAAGSMFLPNLKVYAGHLWHNIWVIGGLLTLAGAVLGCREEKRAWIGELLLYGASGPLFFFLANLPPNPHAMAIVEPHYLLSDLVLALWAVRGAAGLREAAGRWAPTALVVVLAVQPWLLGRFGEMNRRWDLIGHDFVHNVFRSVPRNAALVAKKDIQLFALWYYHRVVGERPDLRLVAQGISHSPWYQASERRFASPLRLWHLKSLEGWERLLRDNAPPVYATMDVELHSGLNLGAPSGLVVRVSSPAAPSELPWRFLVRRGQYRYERRPEFFTADLVGSHATARQGLGSAFVSSGDFGAGRRNLLGAWAMKRRLPEASSFLAFTYFQQGRYPAAAAAYELTDRLYQETLDLTEEYHTLPGLRRTIGRTAAAARMNLGVAYEKLGRKADAEGAYRRALAADPGAAKAHYNIAVLYWREDWPRVIRELEAALRIDPNYAEAKKYLNIARHLSRK